MRCAKREEPVGSHWTGFLSSFFECWVMFEAEGSNLRIKFVDGAASEEDIVFLVAVCTNA